MMSKENSIRKACEKANHVCDKTQYKEASLIEKIKLTIHLLYCRACRKYTNNNQKLTKIVKDSRIECMSTKEKEALNESLTEAIKEHQD
ncbi:hypothetical protein ACFS5M_05255 [Lacinutrix iliipiscaria]|uniref:Glycine dehydrogenase n=1 Tax=Lacinutrix iliipiscaria TaxID=1230532 RepID=A0ABW5WL80_9FLAO